MWDRTAIFRGEFENIAEREVWTRDRRILPALFRKFDADFPTFAIKVCWTSTKMENNEMGWSCQEFSIFSLGTDFSHETGKKKTKNRIAICPNSPDKCEISHFFSRILPSGTFFFVFFFFLGILAPNFENEILKFHFFLKKVIIPPNSPDNFPKKRHFSQSWF